MLTRGALEPLLREGSELKHVSDQPTPMTADTRWIACMSLLRHCWEPDQPCHMRMATSSQTLSESVFGTRLSRRRPDHRLIALHWQGNTEHEQNSYYAKGRSFQFKEFEA